MDTIQQLKVSDIYPCKENTRKINVKSESFIELKNSIAGGGVRVPVHVRKNGKGKFELRAGSRRLRACKELGLATIPAIVHDKMKDLDAVDLTYIENKFRENLKPMEEVREIHLLMNRFGGDAKAIAEKIGRTETWVRLRANIHDGLIEPWKRAFAEPEKFKAFKGWSIGHLTLIARLPAQIQEEFFEGLKDDYYDEVFTVQDLKQEIADRFNLLSKAAWELDDQTLLPEAGACSTCPKRTGHQPALWLDMDEKEKAGDQCLDPSCFQTKSFACLERKAAELTVKHTDLAKVVTDYPNYNESSALQEKFGKYLTKHDFDETVKTKKGAIPALVLYGPGTGTLKYIKLKAKEGPKSRVPGKPTPLAERKAKLDAKRWAQVLIDLQQKLGETSVKNLDFKDKSAGLMVLASLYGVKEPWQAKREVKHADAVKLIKAGQDKAQETLWKSFVPTLDSLLSYSGPITQTPQFMIDDARWIAKLIKVDLKKLFKDVSGRKGFTEPKIWASFKADGTPKNKPDKKEKVKTKKTTKANKGKSK